jgi:ElaB/YqjD/DUF883 family membrane-anchored ribosome-binding protein
MRTQLEERMNVKPLKETLDSVREQASAKVHEIETKAALIASRAQVGFLKASGSAREMIHRRPLTSMFVGFGAGCLIGGLAVLIGERYSKTHTQSSSTAH